MDQGLATDCDRAYAASTPALPRAWIYAFRRSPPAADKHGGIAAGASTVPGPHRLEASADGARGRWARCARLARTGLRRCCFHRGLWRSDGHPDQGYQAAPARCAAAACPHPALLLAVDLSGLMDGCMEFTRRPYHWNKTEHGLTMR